MTRYLSILLLFCYLASGCSNKKKPSLTGDEPVEINDFIESFELVKPPLQVADTGLLKKEKDSLLIANKIFSQFVPDSVLTLVFGKNAKPKIYLMKRVEVEKKENYLFIKVVTNNKRAVLVLCFDRANNYKAYLPLLINDANRATTQVSGLDRRYSFYRSVYLKKADGSLAEGKDVYIYSEDAEKFLLIMTDALDERITEVINPIDTLPRKNKYAADYVKNKMNFVSIRDDKKNDRINFFIHVDQDNGNCGGELKGIANFIAANTAVYKHQGDACSLQFVFSTNSVSIKELEPCGTHRGVKCSFDGSYPRKKETKKTSPTHR